jgi:histone H1/5
MIHFCSRQAIKKYIKSNNSLASVTDAAFNSHINRALAAGEKSGVFERPKGPSGPVKLKKPAAKAAPPKAAPKPAAPKV